ncbi:MAG TPA: NAD(P)/FAD-dependent oxidoreductase [Syntrophomonadaceae bacterium]|nr:NAD(P)/FAD-dependent oxidoreductase [Syntrophomonadaceae bacterium]
MMDKIFDLAILGCGPAGLSAAINAVIRNKKVLVMGTEICSPPLHKAQLIDNYLGIPGVKGEELLDAFMKHAVSKGVQVTSQKAETISEIEGLYHILSGDEVITAKTIVIATGVPYKSTLPKEDYYLGRGLGYCATCDGPIYRNKDVLLIGHSSEAEHEADFMAEICNRVYYLPLYKEIGSLDSRVEVLEGRPDSVIGTEYVEGLRLKDGREIKVEGLFVLGGETAPDRLIPGLEIEDKHIKVNRQQETNLPGVYAAGDCTGPPYQVAKSVGEGQVAGLNAAKYASRK